MSTQVSRRQFLGATGATAGVLALGKNLGISKDLQHEIAAAKVRQLDKPVYEIVGTRSQPEDEENPQFWQNLKEGTPEFDDWAARFPDWVPVYQERKKIKAAAPKTDPIRSALSGAAGWPDKFLAPAAKDGPVATTKIDISEDEAALKVKGLALALGCTVVGIAKLDPYWIYVEPHKMFDPYSPELPKSHKYIIAMGWRGNPDMWETPDSVCRGFETGRVYSNHLFNAVKVAAFIRAMGYEARAHVQDQCLNVAAACDAGLGEPARWGNLLLPGMGNQVRIFSVTTELPMTVDKPIEFGVQNFCEACKLCAKLCPGQAISDGPKTVKRGIKKWWIDLKGCILNQATYAGSCQLCHTICPWNKPSSWLHGSMEWVVSHASVADKTLVALDEMLYGSTLRDRLRRPPNWWDHHNPTFDDINPGS